MCDKIKEFLDKVCYHVRAKAAHKEIRDELVGHIEEMQSAGTTLDAAISSMGDCSEIGLRLDKQHRPQVEWWLIGLVAFIVAIGAVMMFGGNLPHYANVGNYIIWLIIGIGIASGIMFFDYTKLKNIALLFYIAGVILLIFTLTAGIFVNGVAIMRIGSFTISPQLAIIPFVLAFVGFMDRFRGEGVWGIIKLFLLGIVSIFMMVLVPSVAAMLILLGCYAVLMFTAVVKNHFGDGKRAQILLLCSIALLFLIIFGIMLVRNPMAAMRFFGFFRISDPDGVHWLNIQVSNLLSHAQLWSGVRTINGFNLHYFLPGIISEFALANIIISFGWIVGIALVLAISALIVRLFMVTRKIRNVFGFYIALAAYVVLTMQFIINILMNFGLFPILSVTLPFVSFGGSLYVANMVLVGVILSVWRRNNILRAIHKQTNKEKAPMFEYSDGKLVVNFKGK